MTMGQQPTLPTRDHREIEEWIVTWLSKRLKLAENEIAPGMEFVNLGLSSRDAVMLAGELERWLGKELDPTLLWDHPTIEGLASHIAG
jgi:acyl carrier protein